MEIVILSLIFSGIAIATLASMLGFGGGFLIVPLLISVFDLPAKNAIAISLVAVFGTTLSATIGYLKQKRIDFKLSLVYNILDIPGVSLGVYLTTLFSPKFLTAICGILIILISLILMKRRKDFFVNKNLKWKREITDSFGQKFKYFIQNPILVLISSFLGGLVAGLSGLGGGITDTLTMILLGVPSHIAVASSEFGMTLTAGAGIIGHGFFKNILPRYAFPLFFGTIIGAQIGCELARRTKVGFLKKIIGAITFLIGMKLLISALF